MIKIINNIELRHLCKSKNIIYRYNKQATINDIIINSSLNTLDKDITEAKNKVKDKKESINSTKQINEYVKCIIDGEEFNIISTTTLQDNIGCHLATTSKGAVILAFEGSKLRVFRHYDALTSKHIQARLTVNPDGTAPRYIIRNGKNKFIVEIKNNHIEFVMDLC